MAASNLPLAVALLVAVLAAATYQILDKLTVKKYGAATTKVRSRSVGLRRGGRPDAPSWRFRGNFVQEGRKGNQTRQHQREGLRFFYVCGWQG